MRLYLNGGGDGPALAAAYRRFGRDLDRAKPLLYVPLAMEPPQYAGCLAWVTAELESLGVSIRMVSSGEEMAALNFRDFCGIFLGGGNTYTLLKRLKDSGAFEKLRTCLESGGAVFGGSAGAIVFGKTIDTCGYGPCADENTVNLQDTGGLDLLYGLSLFCHYQDGAEIPVLSTPVLALREEQTLFTDGRSLELIGP